MNPDIRWKQRFQNFDRAFILLRDALANGPDTLNQLEREGTVQRFEFCLELAWKTTKDFLEAGGLVINPVTPRQVVKEAFAARVLVDGQVWIDMLHHRNLLAHTYDLAVFDDAIESLVKRYLPAMSDLHEFFITKHTG